MRYLKQVLIAMIIINFGLNAQTVRNFELRDLDNNNRSFNDLMGENLTLLDFWATWCSPCKKAIPELNKIYKSYKNRGVEIIGINGDGPRSISKVKPFAKALQIKYPVLIDMNSELKSDLNLVSFPSLVIVNSEGKVIWVHEGYTSGDDEIIRVALEKYLSTK